MFDEENVTITMEEAIEIIKNKIPKNMMGEIEYRIELYDEEDNDDMTDILYEFLYSEEYLVDDRKSKMAYDNVCIDIGIYHELTQDELDRTETTGRRKDLVICTRKGVMYDSYNIERFYNKACENSEALLVL